MDVTIIIPTFDHGETLQFALQSVARQTLRDFEVVVIGDGVPEPFKPWIREAVAKDSRFSFVDHPKHERRGEPYRNEVLNNTRGKSICYMTDRDIWLPNHLEQIVALLATCDYAHSLPLHVLPNGALRVFACDLKGAGYRYMMSTVMDNRIPFSCFAHSRDAYFKLAEGWATTPRDQWTDLHMWRKFFTRADLRGDSGTRATAATFPTPPRKEWTTQQRVEELTRWAERLDTPMGRADFERDALIAGLQAQRAETLSLASLLDTTKRNQGAGPGRVNYGPRF